MHCVAKCKQTAGSGSGGGSSPSCSLSNPKKAGGVPCQPGKARPQLMANATASLPRLTTCKADREAGSKCVNSELCSVAPPWLPAMYSCRLHTSYTCPSPGVHHAQPVLLFQGSIVCYKQRSSSPQSHQMYIMPRLSLLDASSIRRCACPSTLSGMQGWLDTPSSVPLSRPGEKGEETKCCLEAACRAGWALVPGSPPLNRRGGEVWCGRALQHCWLIDVERGCMCQVWSR